MARGETLGQRRRRRRQERHGGDPDFDADPPITSPRRLAAQQEAALAARPEWVKKIWATPRSRIALSAVFIAIGVWIMVSAFSDPEFLRGRRNPLAFLGAPLLLGAFGLTAFEAIRDLRRGTNSTPSFYRLDEVLWHDRRGRGFLFAYLVFMVGTLVLVLQG